MRSRLVQVVSGVALVAVLTACGDVKTDERVKVESRPVTTTTSTTISAEALQRWYDVAYFRDVLEWNLAVERAEAARREQASKNRPDDGELDGAFRDSSAVSAPSGCQYEHLIRATWQEAQDWAIGIAMRESGCTAGATSPDGARGVFQLLGHVDDGCAYDAACNIAAAWALYQACHEGPWTAPNYGCW